MEINFTVYDDFDNVDSERTAQLNDLLDDVFTLLDKDELFELINYLPDWYDNNVT